MLKEVRKVGGVRRSLACGARLPNTLQTLCSKVSLENIGIYQEASTLLCRDKVQVKKPLSDLK
jgi:hypothetical protein